MHFDSTALTDQTGQSSQPPTQSLNSPYLSAEVDDVAQALLAHLGDTIPDRTVSTAPPTFQGVSIPPWSEQDRAAGDLARAALGLGAYPTGNAIPLGAPFQGFDQGQALVPPNLFDDRLFPGSMDTTSAIAPPFLQPNPNPENEDDLGEGLLQFIIDSTRDSSGGESTPTTRGEGGAHPTSSQQQLGREIGPARRERQARPSSHPYLPPTTPLHLSAAASSAASRQNTSTFFWLGRDSGWIFPPKPVEGAQRPQIGQDILAQCLSCQLFVLPIPDVIAEHQKLHGGDGKLICGHNSCASTFPNKASRTLHLASAHKVEKELYCPVCKMDFKQKKSRSYSTLLVEHFFAHHFGVEIWKCISCDMNAKSQEHLVTHYATCRPMDSNKGGTVYRTMTPSEIKSLYIDSDTGLPLNAHYFTADDGKAKIALYPKGKEPPNPHPVDWRQAVISQPSSATDETS